MGNKQTKIEEKGPVELSPECEKKVLEVFGSFDVDHSHKIDKNEAITHFKGAFARISAKELFNTVDVDHDGSISEEEWKTFWMVVKGCGHDEEEIMQELTNIEMG